MILSLVTTLIKLRHYFETHPIGVKTNYPIKNVMRKLEMLCSITKWYVQVITHDLRYDPRSTIKSQELLYFMADFNAYIQPIMEKDVQWIKDNNIPKK